MTRILVVILLAGCACIPALGVSRYRPGEGTRIQGKRIDSSGHTCALQGDGTIICWGPNNSGQAGTGVTCTTANPARVAGIANALAVTVGSGFSCALLANGTAACWGANGNYQLGDGTNDQRLSPVPVRADGRVLDRLIAIDAGQFHACAIRADGTVWCWGSSSSGQAGPISNSINVQNARQILRQSGAINDAVAIELGAYHSCIINARGTVECWGQNILGELGDGSNRNQTRAVSAAGLDSVVAISAGAFYTCAVSAGGAVRCWGRNQNGQLGDGSTVDKNVPSALLDIGAIDIVAGGSHTCALLADGRVQCWGNNRDGQLGDGSNTSIPAPGNLVAGLANVAAISASSSHSCAIDGRGVVLCWGSNEFKQLGNGTTFDSLTATPVTGIAGSISATGVGAGGRHSCASRSNGTMSCWGTNSDGQLGIGRTSTKELNPTAVLRATRTSGISAGTVGNCVTQFGDGPYCWGDNQLGQLGDGSTADRTSAVVPSLSVRSLKIVTELWTSCAVGIDGRVRCWGHNSSGQLGNGTLQDSTTPQVVSGLEDVIDLAAGSFHFCALKADGTVHCWGSNHFGAIGIGTVTTSETTPVRVLGISDAVAVAAGGGHSCALSANGAVRCWGKNVVGQIGDGTVQTRTVPVVVSSLVDAVTVSTSEFHTCAARVAGDAVCWGYNSDGQLGGADAEDHRTPVPVVRSFATVRGITFASRLASVASINPGESHTCATTAAGAVYCWGSNGNGRIGDGTSTSRDRPTLVPSFTANVDPSVKIGPEGRIARVTALVNCEEGAFAQVYLHLDQGEASGFKYGHVRCTGGIERLPLTIVSKGRRGFAEGPATANVDAIIRDESLEAQELHWTREVSLARQE